MVRQPPAIEHLAIRRRGPSVAEQVVDVVAAAVDEPGGALTAAAAAARREALRPLETAVRVARRAAVTEAVRVLAASPLV